MGNEVSIASRETVPTPRGSQDLGHQERPLAFRHGQASVEEIPRHENARRDPPPQRQKVRRTRTDQTLPTTKRKNHDKARETIGSLLSCSMTKRCLSGDRPMPFIHLDKGSERLDLSGLRDRRRHWVKVTEAQDLKGTVCKAILAVLRTAFKGRSIFGGPDPQRHDSLLFTTSDSIHWRNHFGPCVSCARHGLQALASFGVTKRQVEQLFERKGSGFEFPLLDKLFVNPDERFAFTRHQNTGHAVVKLQKSRSKQTPGPTLVENLIDLTFELRKIGAYDAIFAVLETLDEISLRKPIDEEQLVELCCGLTGASPEEVAKRQRIGCADLLKDLRAQLIVGLCDPESDYFDPLMGAKVMLRQARLNPIAGELPAADMVIEALLDTKIPLGRLEKELGRKKNGRFVSSAEARWWSALERWLAPPSIPAPLYIAKQQINGRTARALGQAPAPLPVPHFSLGHADRYKQRIELHGVDPKPPLVDVIVFCLGELADADWVEVVEVNDGVVSIDIRRDRGDLDRALLRATSGVEAMFLSLNDLGVSTERVERFFAQHRERGTADLFSRGIPKLLARPHASLFGFVKTPTHMEVLPKRYKDGQQSEVARHLVETLSDLVWFGAYDAAIELLPNLIHFLDYIEQDPDLENRMKHLVQALANQAAQQPRAWTSVQDSLRSIKTSLHRLVSGGPRYDPLEAAAWVVRDAQRPDDGQEAEIYADQVIAELARFLAEDVEGDDPVGWAKQEVGATDRPGPAEAAFWARLESRLGL
jgi:hypothetical protein